MIKQGLERCWNFLRDLWIVLEHVHFYDARLYFMWGLILLSLGITGQRLLSPADHPMPVNDHSSPSVQRDAHTDKRPKITWKDKAKKCPLIQGRLRVSIVFYNVGMRQADLDAISSNPNYVLGVNPYGANVEQAMADAQARGNETLLMIPTEPAFFPIANVGPDVLLHVHDAKTNMDRLVNLLDRHHGYIGVLSLGDMIHFAKWKNIFQPMAEILKKKELILLQKDFIEKSQTSEFFIKDYGVPYVAPLVIDQDDDDTYVTFKIQQRLAIPLSKSSDVVLCFPLRPKFLRFVQSLLPKIMPANAVVVPLSCIAQDKMSKK